jgi:toxin-antitoxin system PIN domain toxin
MLLPDVNILIYAFRPDAQDHQRFKEWLGEVVRGDESYGISELVCSGFLRIVTNPRVFRSPDPMEDALRFVEQLRSTSSCVPLSPGPRHWQIFTALCRTRGVRGNLVPDAYLAALAIESGSEWITTDRDFARFPGLRWRHPFD